MITARACIFDVFGTVVDCEGSITRQLDAFGSSLNLHSVDWLAFTQEWLAVYDRRTEIVGGAPGSTDVDILNREVLDEMLTSPAWAIVGAKCGEREKEEMIQTWHKIDAWPDSSAGLKELKKKVIIATLSNGTTRLLIDLARKNDLPWDTIFGGNTFSAYKPSPSTYLGAARLLGLRAEEVCMVAAHIDDLGDAKVHGMKTVYVKRPTEDREVTEDIRGGEGGEVEAVVDSFEELSSLF